MIRRHFAEAAVVLVLAVSTGGCSVFCHFNNSCAVPPDCTSSGPTSPTPTCESSAVHVGSKVLPITPVFQQTLSWCWLASAEMIFAHYRVPPVNGISYQCGVMGAVTGPGSVCFYNCTLCAFGSGSDAASARVLVQYPQIAQQFFPTTRVPQLNATLYERRLSMSEVQQEIDAGHPVELGITPEGPFQGQAAHDVVLVGYSAPDTNTMLVTVNDPAPYDLVVGPAQNPYRLAGGTVLQAWQYQISYSALASALKWSASITTSSY